MNFVNLQSTVYGLIKSSAAFSALAVSTVCEDLGEKKTFIENALDISTTPPGAGYAISVWPPARGHSDSEQAGQTGVDVLIVVRLEVNPQFLLKLPNLVPPQDAGTWVNTSVAAIVSAVLSAPPESGGVQFQLAPDAFELVNFDEGLLAYHIRFVRLAVFGS